MTASQVNGMPGSFPPPPPPTQPGANMGQPGGPPGTQPTQNSYPGMYGAPTHDTSFGSFNGAQPTQTNLAFDYAASVSTPNVSFFMFFFKIS